MIDFPPPAYAIRTPRLLIRTPAASDAEDFIRINNNPRNQPVGSEDEFQPDWDVEKFRDRIIRWQKRAREGRDAFLIITKRREGSSAARKREQGDDDDDTDGNDDSGGGDGVVIGHMSFNCFRTRGEYEGTEPERDDPVPGFPEEGRYLTDVGVVINSAEWRRGYASETVCAAAEFAFAELGCRVVRVETNVGNEPWRALMRSLGLVEEEGPVSYGDREVGWLYKVDREGWGRITEALKEKGRWPLTN